MSKNKYNILFVVCHPDDESLWVGGLLSELSKIKNIQVYVVCLSGNDPESRRVKEFSDAKKISGYSKGIIMGGKLRPANTPLPKIGSTLEEGVDKLGLSLSDISVLITHSPYGDEHRHPHHVQANSELFDWTSSKNIPFGFFSILPLPYFKLMPIGKNMRFLNKLYLLNLSICENLNKKFKAPEYYLQFFIDSDIKKRMMSCYKSVGLKEHKKGYASFSNKCESIYLFDDQGFKPFKKMIESMQVPGSKYLFSHYMSLFDNFLSRLKLKKI